MSEKEDTKPDSDSLRCYAAEVGDYVLATKYSDGDPCDHFYVGFVSGYTHHGRYMIVDNEGNNQRGNGFRRVEKLTDNEGRQLVGLMSSIGDRRGPSVWWHLSNIRGVGQDAFCQACKYEKDGACRCDTSA
ncbi:MAG: hypothetical protein IPH59_11765 [bacterium]|nr:hypothetical protein [bacterium]